MRALVPLIVLTIVIFRHQRRKGRPSLIAYAAAALLWAVVVFKVTWPL
jgi:hypothetical protein